MNTAKRNLMCAASFLGCALVLGCSDEVTSLDATSLEKQATIADEECSDGTLTYEEKSGDVYVCQKERWTRMFNEAESASCTMRSLKDSSGYKVVCNGDSLGVVKSGENGKNGSDGKNSTGKDGSKGSDGASCTLKAVNDSLKIVCGDSSVVLGFAKSAPKAMKSYSVKGAFRGKQNDDVLRIASFYPLDENLVSSGTFFRSPEYVPLQLKKAADGYKMLSGEFEVSFETDAPYAKIVLDNVDGKLNKMATMAYAMPIEEGSFVSLVELADSSTFVVSNLSTVTYDRIVSLMKSGKKYKEAKAQAQKELFTAFGLDGKSKSMDSVYVGEYDETDALNYLIGTILGNYDDGNWTWMEKIRRSLAVDGTMKGLNASDTAELLSRFTASEIEILDCTLYNIYEGEDVIKACKSPASKEEDCVYPTSNYKVNMTFFENVTGVAHCDEDHVGIVDTVKSADGERYFGCAYDGRWSATSSVEQFPCHEPKDVKSAMKEFGSAEWTYVCDEAEEKINNKIIEMGWMWRRATDLEKLLGKACMALNNGGSETIEIEDVSYGCVEGGWTKFD